MLNDPEYLAERDRRIALLNDIMAREGLDALLLTSTAQQAYQVATKYISAYPLTTRRDFVFVEPGKTPRLVVPTVGQQFHARRLSWLPEDCVFSGPMTETVCGWIRALGLPHPRIGMYDYAELPVSIDRAVRETGAEIVDVTRAYTLARQPKSEFEVRRVREASDLAVASFEHVVRVARLGMSERELIGAGEVGRDVRVRSAQIWVEGRDDVVVRVAGEGEGALTIRMCLECLDAVVDNRV